MEKRKWLWKKRSSDRGPGDTESSGSLSSHSERFSDDQEQEGLKTSPNDNNLQSPEVSSKASANSEDVDSVKALTEKLSAALVNVSAKEELVKQHAKVAEEAIAGWEKAENEVAIMKQKFETATKHSSKLEDRVSHLDGALKECVRQLRQAKEDQEQKIREAVSEATRELETTKLGLESQLVDLQKNSEAFKPELPKISTELIHKIEALEKENSALKLELLSRLEELELRRVERDLSTHAAEVASKQHLESINKVAKLEAECRRLKAVICKSSPASDRKSATAPSFCIESITDSVSDSGERQEIDNKNTCGLKTSNTMPSISDSWASALIAELDQFKNVKASGRNLAASSADIDLMDDFLEMEQFAALDGINSDNHSLQSENAAKRPNDMENSLRVKVDVMTHQVAELEKELEKIERQKIELEIALTKSQENITASELQLKETEAKLVEMHRELDVANEAKQLFESQLIAMKAETQAFTAKIEILESEVERQRTSSKEMTSKFNELEEELSRKGVEAESKHHLEAQLVSMEAKAQTMSAKIASLESELEKERTLSEEISAKCKELEEELARKEQEAESKQLLESQIINLEAEARIMSAKVDSLESEVEKKRTLLEEITVKCRKLEEELSRRQEDELQQVAKSNAESKMKEEEDLSVAAGKLAECQKTIASLGKQLESLATLEDFLIDTTSIPGFSSERSMFPKAAVESWKVCSNESYDAKSEIQTPKLLRSGDSYSASATKNEGSTPPSSSSSSSIVSDKNRNGFAKFFTRSKNGIHLEI